MQFLKKNYEKVLLIVVLLGLIGAMATLPFLISSKRAELDAAREQRTRVNPKPVPPLDTTQLDATLARAQTPVLYVFTKEHNLVNPVRWIRGPDGHPIKPSETKKVGPELLEIVTNTPLYLRLTFNSVSADGYLIGVNNEAATKNRTGERYAQKGRKNDVFTIQDVKGPADKPTALVLELTDGGQMVTLSPGKPFERVEGYEVDLRYPPDKSSFHRKRRDESISLGGESYKIASITSSNVVVSAKQNDKKTTINYKP